MLKLANGIPFPDTFGRVIALIDPKQFEASFHQWVQGISTTIKGVIAIDGKTSRRTHNQAAGKKALHLVSAEQIIECQGDYALALKDNQGNLSDEVQATFTMTEKEAFVTVACELDRTIEKAHGRLEIREYWTISDPAMMEYLDPEKRW